MPSDTPGVTVDKWSWASAVLGVARPAAAADGDQPTMPIDVHTQPDDDAQPVALGQGGTRPAENTIAPSPTPAPQAAAPQPAQAKPADPDRAKALAALNALADRYNKLKPSFEMEKADTAFTGAYAKLAALFAAGKFAQVLAGIAAVDAALKTVETMAAELPKKIAAATKEADTVNKMTDDAIGKMSAADKAKAVETLLAGGAPTGDTRKAQIKIYKATKLDPAFVKADDDRGKAIADDFKGDKEMKTARTDWKKLSEADMVKALTKIVAVQSKHFGIPPPKIVVEHNPPAGGLITSGFFNPEDGQLHLNMDPASTIHTFQNAIDLALHENAHNWQYHLVADLKAGKLKKGDTNYDQALMFAVNQLNPGGYVPGAEDLDAYQKQPMENHSWNTGPATAQKILKVL